MITNCFGGNADLSDTEAFFVQGVFALIKVLIPVAICVYTLKVSKAERPHQRASVLGLEERTSHEHDGG